MTGTLRIERPKGSLRKLAQDAVRQAIMDLRFVPGERLIERTLCDELQVSRTVVREVLRYLEAEGVVEVAPYKGPIVARIRAKDAEQIYELRALLESSAAGACAAAAASGRADLVPLEQALRELEEALESRNAIQSLRATGAFYEHMFAIAGRDIAYSVVKSFNVRINALRALTISTGDRQAAAAREMRRLFDAIASGDVQRATAASAEHVENAAKVARPILEVSENDENYLTRRLEMVRYRVPVDV